MDFLLAERKLVEQLVEPAGLPTRTEIDELHHTVQTLKRRVRALETGSRAPTGGLARKRPLDRGKAPRKG